MTRGIILVCDSCLKELTISQSDPWINIRETIETTPEAEGWRIPRLIMDTHEGLQEVPASSIKSYCPDCKEEL